YENLAATIGESENRQALVFIHGYNVTFNDAVRRTAQIAYDLAFDVTPILYSWPSQGKLHGYPADENTIEWTVPQLTVFLTELAQAAGATTIHLVAHSMGNRALVKALERLATNHAAIAAVAG